MTTSDDLCPCISTHLNIYGYILYTSIDRRNQNINNFIKIVLKIASIFFTL